MKVHVIREMPSPRADACESIMRALPEWFGIDSYIESYAREAEEYPTYGAYDSEGKLLGFMTLRAEDEGVTEIHAMGVLPNFHGQGVGRALVAHARDISLKRGYRVLRVKTLGPSVPDLSYQSTRAFYGKMGFEAVEERDDIWSGNPCLIMELPLRNA